MFHARCYKQDVTGLELSSGGSIEKHPRPRHDDVDFIPVVGLLLVNFVGFIEFNDEGAVLEEFNKQGLTFLK